MTALPTAIASERERHSAVPAARVHDLLKRHGSAALSFVALESEMDHWFDEPPPTGTGGCVAYADTGSAWVAAGDPIVAPSDRARAAARFVDAARGAGRRACFFASEFLEGDGFHRIQLGEQPIYRTAQWRKTVSERRRLREQLRRANAKGVRVRRVEASELRKGEPLRRDVEGLVREWLASRHLAEMRFLLAVEPFHEPAEHLYLVAEHDGRVVEFLSAVPIYTRKGWLVEDVVRSRYAPNGTTESLFHALMSLVGDDEFVTLGLAPLTGPVAPWMRAVRFIARPLYSFVGLRAFKERLRPVEWQPVWLVAPKGLPAFFHLVDALRAFAGGSFLGFAARSLRAHPSGPPFALALPLVPWTLLLAGLLAGHRASVMGFSQGALAAWTLFDAALLVLLVRCAMRPFRATLLLATAAASVDALLSIVHLVRVGDGSTLLEASMRTVATLAPVFGAAALAWASGRAMVRTLPSGRATPRRSDDQN